ncbi:MAG: hypothetical protein ABIA67_06730 [Candidatus Margulisiibacteriota bacterium]
MKYLSLLLVLALVFSFASNAEAQTKIIRKTVKKVVKPQISPVQPPKVETTKEIVPDVPPPPPPPTYDVTTIEKDKGLLGWGLNADIGGKLLFGSLMAGVRGDVIFADPLMLGEKIGLAEDAVEYKVGLGFALTDTLKTVPLYADAIVYLKEGSLFGMDPYVGAGLNYNLYGTGKVSGGLGGQLSLGVLADFGLGSRTEIALGYGTHKVGDNLSVSGLTISLSQPIRL